MSNTSPKLYVGTWHKYASGSIAGKWLELDDYSDQSEFYSACHELHRDEHDPEFMFQDAQNLPYGSYGESWVSEQLWEFFDLGSQDQEVVLAYSAISDFEQAMKVAVDRFAGCFDSHNDFVEEWIENMGIDIPTCIEVDLEATWRANLTHDYSDTRIDGENYYFHA